MPSLWLPSLPDLPRHVPCSGQERNPPVTSLESLASEIQTEGAQLREELTSIKKLIAELGASYSARLRAKDLEIAELKRRLEARDAASE